MQLSIQKKMVLVCLVCFVELTLVITLFFYSARHHAQYESELKSDMAKLEKVKYLQHAINSVVMPINDFLIAGSDQSEPDNFRVHDVRIRKMFNVIAKLGFDTAEDQEILNNLEEMYYEIKSIAGKVFSLPDPVGNPLGGELMEEADKIADEMASIMIEFYLRTMDGKIREGQENLRRTETYNYLILLIGNLLNFGFAMMGIFYLRRAILSPIISIRDAAEGIAQGDLNRRIAVTSKDEIGQLAVTFNDMAARLKDYYAHLEEIVESRTKELSNTNQQLQAKEERMQKESKETERFNQLAVGRELKMIDLKQEVNALLGELGRDEEYRIVSDDTGNGNDNNKERVWR